MFAIILQCFQYPENNKFIPKSNNYSNRNNPNNRLQRSILGNHNNQFRENGNKEDNDSNLNQNSYNSIEDEKSVSVKWMFLKQKQLMAKVTK